MKNNLKRFLLCFLAVSALALSGTTYAENEPLATEQENSENEENTEEISAKLKESEETVELTEEQAKKLLKFIGTSDGLDIYKVNKNYEEEIWAAHGGKPEKKAELTPSQEKEKELAEEEISTVKKLGEIVAVDSKKGIAVASFDKHSKCDEGLLYISDGGRLLLTIDEELSEPERIVTVISTIDDPCVFRSSDGQTLYLTDKEHKKIIRTFSKSGIQNNMSVFHADDESFVWLNASETQVYGVFRYGASNESYRLIVDDRNGLFGLENLKTGYIWWSAPFGATRDTLATPLLVDELRSSSVLRYGIPEKRSNNNVLRSDTNDCEMKVSDISDGIRIEYNYKAGFSYPVEYTLEGDHLKASLKVSEIKETSPSNIATEITLLGAFGAGSEKEEGYFVIPDGSGALIRFNSNKTTEPNAYSQRVYGNDITAVPTSRGAVTEQIYLPCYAIVKENNAMLVVASKGDSNAVLSAQLSGQSNTNYNLCNFTFTLRGTDIFYMSGKLSDKVTIFEGGEIKSDDIELLYYPISKEGADFTDAAECYRNHLIEEKGITPKTQENYAPMYVDFYGGTEKKKSVLGIPVNMKQSVTSYAEAQKILGILNENSVDDIVVTYTNWSENGIQNKVDKKPKVSGTLGGTTDFQKLNTFIKDNDYSLYPVSDSMKFLSGDGYYSFSDTSVRISGAYSRIVSYDRAYGVPDGFRKNMSLLSPDCFSELFTSNAESFSSLGIDGISAGELTSALYGDYGKKNISRFKSMELLKDSFKNLDESLENGILAKECNAYAFPYVSHITDIPLSSSRFDIFSEDIPFFQMVMHGLIPLSSTAVNGDADSETLLLKAVSAGSCLRYDMIYSETNKLKDTEFDIYYYADYRNWTDTASAEYKLTEPILKDISDSFIIGYETENNGKHVTTSYSNGTVVKVDFENKTIDFNGELIDISDAQRKGGLRF